MLDPKGEGAPPGARDRLLSSVAAFEGLDLTRLAASCRTRFLRDGERLLGDEGDGDWLYVVASGCLDLRVQGPSGTVATRVLPGDLLSDSSLRFHLPRSTSAIAAEPTELTLVPVAALDQVLPASPEIRRRIDTAASQHLLRLELAANEMFSGLGEDLLADIARKSDFVFVKRGEIVIREGDASDGIYLVVSGSLEVFRTQADGTLQSFDLLREGASVGEMASLLDAPRSTSVRAWRDALLIRVPDSCMQEVFQRYPQVTLKLARTLGERLARTTAAERPGVRVKTIAVVRWCREPYFSGFARAFALAFETAGHGSALLTAADPDAPAGDGDAADRYAAWLAAKEAAHAYVICRCDDPSSSWSASSIRRADLVVVVAMLGDAGPSGESAIVESARSHGARVELVLLRDASDAIGGTAAWLEAVRPAAHHHVRHDGPGDCARVVRRITGTSRGVILGGGGARGLAHIGVLKALDDAAVPIDALGGTSMGAVIAGLYASGLRHDEILAACRRNYVQRHESDLTVPFVSLRSGGASFRGLHRMFGERRLEDLPLSCFFVSCDLTRAETVTHDRGSVAMWARVSSSVPGLLPPVAHDGRLLVDGGLLDNLPVSTMRARCGGYVIASDVSVARDLPVPRELEMRPSWSGVGQIVRKLTHRPRLPHIIHLLMRSAEISSVRDSKLAGSPADLYLHPPLDSVSMTDFHRFDQIVQAGYDHASERLREWREAPVPAAGGR